MINNVTDLKSRTMVESNILKSIILSSTDDRLPSRDDILIHDYQIANSVTINSILSNYIVNLKYAWQKMSSDETTAESYFRIVDSLKTSQYSLDDETKMVLEVAEDGTGTFKARKMVYQASEVKLDENIVSFHNLDSVWYGKQRNTNKETGNEYDTFVIVEGMNDFYVNPNPYGMNIFSEVPMYYYSENRHQSFNQWALEWSKDGNFYVKSISQNLFYRDYGSSIFSRQLNSCKYILCTSKGLIGIAPGSDDSSQNFVLVDLGSAILNLDQDRYEFESCGFQVVDGLVSMILVVTDSEFRQHYLLFNEDSCDTTYGLKEIKSVVINGLVVDASQVFNKVESVRQLDSLCIALTDYGFWDVEPNTTNYVTYSYNGLKNYYAPISPYGNALKTKIVRPEFPVGTGQFKIVEYDKEFDKVSSNSGTNYWTCNYVSYLDAINSPSGTQHDFVGGTDSFAVYNATTTEPAYIVPHMTDYQFNELLFSSPDLLNEFLDYFYEQSVHNRETDSTNPPYGEYYLKQNHASFRHTLNALMDAKGEFNNLKYSATANDLVQKFASILQLVQQGKTSEQYGSWNLHTYCANLDTELNTEQPISWLIKTPSEQYLKGEMDNWFKAHEYTSAQKDALNISIVDGLISEYPLLGHFQEYFREHVFHHLDIDPSGVDGITINSQNLIDVVSSVRDMIKNQVMAALVLKDETYDGIQSYLQHYTSSIRKDEVRGIMSMENIKNQMVLAVKSTPFFNDSHTYLQMKDVISNSSQMYNLFKLSFNENFAAKSGLVSDGKLNVNWDVVRNFLYPSAMGIPQEDVLKAFVRTQIYRPLYFKHDNYANFTSDDSRYWCETRKIYIDHDGLSHELKFSDRATWAIDLSGSGLNPSSAGYAIDRVEYDDENNVLKYEVRYDLIAINNDKFVHQDVEYYVRRDPSGQITSVLYNEFQKQMQSECKKVTIGSDGRFSLNGKEYQLELERNTGTAIRISVDSATTVFEGEKKEFKCEIVDDMFKMDGTWYVLVKQQTGEYTGLAYAKVDDTKLVSIPVDVSSGTCVIQTRNIKFRFYSSSGSGAWNRVNAVLSHWSEISDHVSREWCEFDMKTIQFNGEQSHDWYLANLLVELYSTSRSVGDVLNLGDGILYQGGLDRTACTVKLVHEVQDGYVVSKCVLTKKVGDNPSTQSRIGVLYDKDMKAVKGKILHGTMSDDGILTESADGTSGDAFIMIDPRGKKNNTNLVKIARSAWTSQVRIQNDVGTLLDPNDDNGAQAVDFGMKSGYPSSLSIRLVETTTDNNIVYNWYEISPNADGSGKYRVRQTGEFVSAFVNGVRYAINVNTKSVNRLQFGEIGVETMDFSTQYTFEQLRDNLLNNLKQYMMNQIVQSLVDNGSLSSIQLNPDLYMSDGSGLFLDMFPDDVSLADYMAVNGIRNQGLAKCQKFLEVFKNSITDMDDSRIYLGRVYQFLNGKIQGTFGNQTGVTILNMDTIIPQLKDGNDTFSYEVLFDLHLMQDKGLMEKNSYQKKWIVGDFTIRNLRCTVTFTPEYVPSSDTTTGSMKYRADYLVTGYQDGKCDVDYDQIIYCVDGIVKKKSIPSQTKTGVAISQIPYSDETLHALSDITNETIANKIEDIFTNDEVISQFIAINNQLGDDQILVDSEIRKYPEYGTWELDVPIPTFSLPGTLVYVNRGNVLIDGDIYDVVAVGDQDKYLEQQDGPGRFEIIKNMCVHKYGEDALPVTDDGVSIEKEDYETEKNWIYKNVIKGDVIVSKTDADSMFSLCFNENSVFMKFKGSDYDFLYPTYEKPYDVNLSEIKHMEELVKTFNERVLIQGQTSENNHSTYRVKEAQYDSASDTITITTKNVTVAPDGTETDDPTQMQGEVIGSRTTCILLNPYVPYVAPSDDSGSEPTDGSEDEEEELPDGILAIGNDLNQFSSFTLELTADQIADLNDWRKNTSPTFVLTHDVDFTGYYEYSEQQQYSTEADDDDTDDSSSSSGATPSADAGGTDTNADVKTSGWFGHEGKFTLGITLKKEDSGEILVDRAEIIKVSDNTCITLNGIPSHNIEIGSKCSTITECTLVKKDGDVWVDIQSSDANLSEPVSLSSPTIEVEYAKSEDSTSSSLANGTVTESNNEEDADISSVSIRYKVYARVINKILAIAPEEGQWYATNDFMVGKQGGGYYVKGICNMTDFLGNSVGSLNYGYVEYPVNLSELKRQRGTNFNHDDIEYRTTCFMLDGSGVQRTLGVEGGRYCPCAVHVLTPEDSSRNDGEIYDRFYEVAIDVTADHSNISTDPGQYSHGKFWMDKAGTLKSISHQPTGHEYKNLIYSTDPDGRSTSVEDTGVPEQMRESLWNLVNERCKLDSDYFESMLDQLNQFLQTVFQELEGRISQNNLLNMCVFDYSKKVTFAHHTGIWNDESDTGGLFGYQRDETTYKTCRDNFNNYLKGQFKGDFSSLNDVDGVQLYDDPSGSDVDKNKLKDYNHILLPYSNSGITPPKPNGLKEKVEGISTYTDWDTVGGNNNRLLVVLNRLRNSIINQLGQSVGNPDESLIDTVFSKRNRESVRYISAIPLDVTGEIIDMFVANGYCNLFHKDSDGNISWNRFVSGATATNSALNKKYQNGLDFMFETTRMNVLNITNSDWLYKFGNRDLYHTSTISDQFFLHCQDTTRQSGDNRRDLWYHSEIDGYLYSEDKIVDMAYEQFGNSTYVIFDGDLHLYRYDNLDQIKDFDGFIHLNKDNATMKIETRHSTQITGNSVSVDKVFIDYNKDEDQTISWMISIYGGIANQQQTYGSIESWDDSPGSETHHFRQYNTVIFGDTLFNNSQLRFQNISKNKDMFDILDIYEVDGNYYGMFKNESDDVEQTFMVFKSGPDSEVVEKLPYRITNQNFYRSLDDLYSLFVVQKDPVSLKTILREISVPDSDIYKDKVIDIEDILPRPEGVTEPLEVQELIMSKFRPMDSATTFFVLSNWGFYKVGYTNRFRRVSIDTIDELKNKLWNSLNMSMIKKHLTEKHEGPEQSEYFDTVSQKVNQFSDDFDVFSLIPAEFGETQDVGVIPSGKIDDTDRDSDHRPDSVLMSTDILQTQGMVAQTDTNPGIVTCAVSNPDTNYGSNPEVMKSQRNPLIEGTGFYDFMYDSDGKVLMDLYQIPFIYQVNSNNTYDLYINVPTTRTKYLNRIAGTLKPDMTTQVTSEEVRARKNFQNSLLPNNLNDSTTKLRVYIDRKYISIGNVELAEISGNSIPLQVYRDVPNNGLYDSIALEGRWDGKVVELKDSVKDVNKVMLEFECYGTDSQSIHIQGKTLVNRALDDKTYQFAQ